MNLSNKKIVVSDLVMFEGQHCKVKEIIDSHYFVENLDTGEVQMADASNLSLTEVISLEEEIRKSSLYYDNLSAEEKVNLELLKALNKLSKLPDIVDLEFGEDEAMNVNLHFDDFELGISFWTKDIDNGV
jgi:hypothetical protein